MKRQILNPPKHHYQQFRSGKSDVVVAAGENMPKLMLRYAAELAVFCRIKIRVHSVYVDPTVVRDR